MDMQVLNTVLSIFAFVLGAMVGSFLNVCIYRIPRGLSVVRPRSKCPQCESPIAWFDNIPIVSWLVLGAKCRHCGRPISWQYPVVEAITGTLFCLVFWRYGLVLATPIYMALSAALVLVTFVDLTDWTIPNEVTYPGIPLGVVCSLVAMVYPASGLHVRGSLEPVFESLLGIVVGGGSLYLLDKLALLVLKKPGMGFGDVKLNAMLGAFFGWQSAIAIVVIASMVGAVAGVLTIVLRRDGKGWGSAHVLPFGPYLSLAGVIIMLYGPQLISLYTSQLGFGGNTP